MRLKQNIFSQSSHWHNPEPHPHSERLTATCALSIIGGFLDIYSYLYRGKVFANAVTGNMVLFGFSLATRDWHHSAKYFLAIFFYALGIFTAELIHWKFTMLRSVTWHQTIILIEALCLLPISFLPFGEWDFIANAVITFVCALQVQTFRKVRGLPFASTMCTGNLRSGTAALFVSVREKDTSEFHKALHYFLVIGCFIVGAILGAVLLPYFGPKIFLLAPAGLLSVFLVLSPRWLAAIRKTFRKKKKRNY